MRHTFLGRFIANPRQVGSLTPSSEALVRTMLSDLPIEGARRIVELGPGTGTFTRAIAERLTPGSELVAFEVDHVFAATLRDRLPRVRVIEDSAEYLTRHLPANSDAEVDIIVSGLPFANFPQRFREQVLYGARAVLRPGGHFVTYQYAHARVFSRSLEDALRATFAGVEVRFTMANVPPAFVFHARA